MSAEEAFLRAAHIEFPEPPATSDDQIDLSDIPEQDFTGPDVVRGKHYHAVQAALGYVRLEPDVRRVFPNADAVNRALRGLIEIAKSAHE
ncbi:MAG: hypothetical protein ACREM2_08850 [Vulcanimicrobiaceae bacterium]